MTTPSSITAIWSRLGIEFGAHEVFAASATVAAFAENPDLVDKIGLFHWGAKISIRGEAYQPRLVNMLWDEDRGKGMRDSEERQCLGSVTRDCNEVRGTSGGT